MVDSLSDLDRHRLEQLNSLLREDLATLYDIDRKLAAATRPLEMRQLRQDAEQVRANYDRLREEYAGLLRKEISTRYAPGEEALIDTVVQRLNADQLIVTRTALQEVDRDPNNPELTQLSAALVAALPSIQQQLVAKNMAAANHVAQVAQAIQASTADAKQRLKLSIPLIPLILSYETEFTLNITANLKATWERLKERFHPW